MTNPSAPSQDALNAQIKSLEAKLLEVRKLRVATQRRVAERSGLEASIERTSRDRSTRSTTGVDAERSRVQGLFDELVESWGGVDRVRHMTMRMRTTHLDDYGPLDEALAAEARVREAIAQKISEAGLDLVVPAPAGSRRG